MYVILLFALRLPLKRDKIHMVSQMAQAKNLGELFMARLENLYNILCLSMMTCIAFSLCYDIHVMILCFILDLVHYYFTL